LRFEVDLEKNLTLLHRQLCDGSYKIGRNVAFVISAPDEPFKMSPENQGMGAQRVASRYRNVERYVSKPE
jgi:hypothetical protein